MNRRNFLQMFGISLAPSMVMGENNNTSDITKISWKDIKKEQPTDDTRLYLTWSECYKCPVAEKCCYGYQYILRNVWCGRTAKQFAFCRQPWRITHWTYLNFPDGTDHAIINIQQKDGTIRTYQDGKEIFSV